MRQVLVVVALGVGTHVGWAQDEEEERKLGWADAAELSFVMTAGNSEASTFGFRNDLTYTWTDALFRFEVAGVRTESGTITRVPVGTSPDDFEIVKSSVSELTAESYLARAKYDHNITDRFFAYGSGGWNRNEFSGIKNRYYGAGGVGNIWYDRDALRWRTDYGLSVTREEGTVADPRTFAGLRLSSSLLHKPKSNIDITNETIADQSFESSSDFRLDTVTALGVSLTDRLALKVSLRLLFDNEPATVETPLEFPPGNRLDILVPVPADKLDTFFATALVINF